MLVRAPNEKQGMGTDRHNERTHCSWISSPEINDIELIEQHTESETQAVS